MTAVRLCSECYNIEDRRDIEGYALCLREHDPAVSCDDFNRSQNSTVDIRFCSECKNFEGRENGLILCARKHRPRSACADFIDKNEALRKARNKKETIHRG